MCKINGRKLKEMRENAGVTQREMAKNLGLSDKTFGHYEQGVTSPSDETVDKICMILRINRDEIEMQNVGYDFTSGESKTVSAIRQRKGFVRFSTPLKTEQWIDDRRNGIDEAKEVKVALSNAFGIGKKKYILISPICIHIPKWQRDTDMAKAREISDNFDEAKFDPIKAYVGIDGKLYVSDGAHRLVAFVYNEEVKILVEVLNCNEKEAIFTFLGQSSGRKTMTTNDTYRAGVEANIEDYLNFKEFFEKHNVQITAENEMLQNAIGTVRPSMQMLRMVKTHREELEKIMNIIQKLEWCGSEQNVYILRTFQVLKKLYASFGEGVEQKLLNRCKGATFYESKVAPIYKNAELFDFLSKEISR